MKITCTKDEKRRFIETLNDSDYCPMRNEDAGCPHETDTAWSCRVCIEKGIEWDIQDGGNTSE